LVDRDDAAELIWRDAADATARALAAIVSVMDPPAIILGGGISLAGPRLLSMIKTRLEENQRWREPPQLLLGAFGLDAGTRGAAIVAADNLAYGT
jgi:glucokinase